MNPKIANLIRENRAHPYVLSVYDILKHRRDGGKETVRLQSLSPVWRRTYTGRVDYETGYYRVNMDLRFPNEEDRLEVAESLDGQFKIRVWDDL